MNQDSALYLFFRPVWKSILHLLTGQTEIERVSRNGDVHDLGTFIGIKIDPFLCQRCWRSIRKIIASG